MREKTRSNSCLISSLSSETNKESLERLAVPLLVEYFHLLVFLSCSLWRPSNKANDVYVTSVTISDHLGLLGLICQCRPDQLSQLARGGMLAGSVG